MVQGKPRYRLAGLLAAALWAGCRGGAAPAARSSSTDPPAGIDARTVLRAHLSHGMGRSPLDDPLWEDSAHAALLVAAATGVATAELMKVAGAADSGRARVDRLLQRGLLVSDGRLLRPSFPILAGSRAHAYYALIERTARAVLIDLLPALDSLRAELESRGWSDWAYHFLWSQVLDSQFAWVVMVERGLVPPLSTVVAWAIYPEHPWKTGTNYVPEEPADYFMAISWTPGGSSLAAIYEDWRPIYDAALAGAPADSATAARLRPLRLLDDRGNVTLPVVHDHDPLYERLRQLSTRATSTIAALLPVHELETLTHLDRQLVFAMAYHDVGWEMLRLAAEAGRVVRPRALTAGDVEDMRGAAAVIALYPPFLRLFGQ